MDALTFHILGLAHLPTNKEYQSCAYTQKIVNLVKMLHNLGHKTTLYCGEGSDTQADEQVVCVSQKARSETYGNYDWKKDFFKHDPKDLCHQTFNTNAIREINNRKQGKDFLLCPMGNYQKPISDAVGLVTVESGIGYTGVFSKYKVFESYAWMHYVYGLQRTDDGNYYDAVIQNYYDPADFSSGLSYNFGSPYYLFIGRLIQRKGLQIAIETTEKIGAKLLVAGQGNLKDVEGRDFSNYTHVTHIGTVNPELREQLYRGAIATFVPTTYIGPFEGVHIESMLCGTPVITTDWGVFTETVKHGVSGYRCRTLDDFIFAAKHVDGLHRDSIRSWSLANYSIDRVKFKYQEYFTKLFDLWDKGWYKERPDRESLSWLKEYNE